VKQGTTMFVLAPKNCMSTPVRIAETQQEIWNSRIEDGAHEIRRFAIESMKMKWLLSTILFERDFG
jgi:hypothetical protein